MKKFKYNPRIAKKTVLYAILALIVFFFGYSIVVSFISTEITTQSRDVIVEIPAGDYRDYLLEKVGMQSDQYDDTDENDVNAFTSELKKKQPKVSAEQALNYKKSYADRKSVEGSGDEWNGSYVTLNPEAKELYVKSSEDKGFLNVEGSKNEVSSITWEFDIAEEGFYYVKLDYLVPTDEKTNAGANAERAIYVKNGNGESELLFDALGSMIFYRIYEDSDAAQEYYKEHKQLEEDLNGNNIKPSQQEVSNVRRNDYLQDDTGYVRNPYLFYLTKGSNEITIKSIREDLVIFNIEVCSASDYELPSYKKYIEEMEAKGYEYIKDYKKTYQAEDSTIRKSSSPTLYPISDRNSSANTPSDPVLQKYNAVGGSKWSTPGDYLSWTVEVETAGLYNIAFRTKQDLSRGLFATRKLYVNGEVPFSEAENCRFFYDSAYSIAKLGGVDGESFSVYLKEGTNEIKLKAVVGDYSDLISQVKIVVDDLNDLYLRIITITTPNPDEYQNYRLYGDGARLEPDDKGRTMQDIFADCAKTLTNVSKRLSEITGEKSSYSNTLDELALQIGTDGGFASKPRNVTKDLAEFKTNLSALGTWVLDIQSQSLTIESFTIYSTNMEDELPKSEDNFFASLWYDIKGFFLSFFFDYESVGVTSESDGNEIEVWFLSDVSSGREQCNAIKSLIDQTFTPVYDINVVLKIVAPGVLLPATLAGTGPDVAINVDGGLPVNYALRGAVYDISEQEDYEEAIIERFNPLQLTPFSLLEPDGSTGVYGLPNTMSFYLMFYRTDIFEERGWEVPKTWDEVIDLITEMQVSNLQFYMPLEGDGGTMFATLLYQNGGQYYTDDQSASALDEEIALQTFEQWCSFFTNYSFELAANFSNRFRSGEMPIGIASYTLFNTLAVFAPDIAGKWAFAPLPGQTIENNQTIFGQTAVVIMKDSDQKDESWEFIKWWTETETQVLYAKEMESILGSAARHNTANRYAIEQLAWTQAEIDIITEMWDNGIGIPAVPGSYYIGRNLENSIRAVINSDANPRETFKEYIEQINAEITRKRIEFGFEKKKD